MTKKKPTVFGVPKFSQKLWSEASPPAAGTTFGDPPPGEVRLMGPIVTDEMLQWTVGSVGTEEGVTFTSGEGFRSRLSRVDGDVTVRVHSPGGAIHEGVRISTSIRERIEGGDAVRIIVDSVACSAAALPLWIEGASTSISEMGLVMVHPPWYWVCGTADELEKEARLLRKLDAVQVELIKRKTGADSSTIRSWVEESATWVGQEAVDVGVIDQLYVSKPADRKNKVVRSDPRLMLIDGLL